MNQNITKQAIALLVLSAALPLAAQTTNPSNNSDANTGSRDKVNVEPAATEETILLSPFEVTSVKDTGYQATETLAGTRIRTDLRDVGSAISVVTKEFMKDVGATDNSTLLQYTPNAEVAGTRGTYAGLGNATSIDENANLRAPASAQRVRGLASADNTRDFFVSDIPWDAYNVDRVDIQRGPNSILFGLGSPAGIVNASLRNAEFRNSGSVESRVGSYGSVRTSADFNQVLIPKVLSIRLDGLWNKEKYEQDPAYQDDKRFYGALRFEPQLFGPSAHTSIKAKFENGDIKANRPRIVPPNDNITPWFRPTEVTASNPFGGMNKTAVNNGYDSFRNDTANIVAGDGRGLQQSSTVNYMPWITAPVNQQQAFWLIDGTTNQLYRVVGGYINPGARNPDGTVRGASLGIVGKRYSDQFFGIQTLPQYATAARLPGYQYGQYKNQSLLDPSVFDFYNTLIDGDTKKEWEKWNSANIDLSQTLFNDRLGIELSYDRQKYKRGGENLLGTPGISIDILKNFQDYYLSGANGTTSVTNANYGRPYVTAGQGGGSSYESDRKYTRASLFGELRASDFLKNDFLVRLLGKHRLNGVYSNEKYQTENLSWVNFANSKEWAAWWNGTDGSGSPITDRGPMAFIYLGSSLATKSTASGANIPGITAPVTYTDSSVYTFDSTWQNYGTAYNAAWTPTGALANIYDSSTSTGATTQASNPANYVGWNNNFKTTLLRYNNGSDKSLTTKAQKSYRVTRSYAGSWQGYLWNNAFVPTLGWRYDEVKSKGVTAAQVSSNRSILNLQPDVYRLPDTYPTSQIFKDHSTSGGIVVHLNKLLRNDPLPINVSLSYNKSSNFQVTDLRRDIYGNAIGNPNGTTKDYGILLSTKNDKISFRAVKYETAVSNSSTQLDTSGLGSAVQQGLKWRNVFLYQLAGYDWATRNAPQDRNNWQPATGQTQADADAQRDASIRAWNQIQTDLTAKGYFKAWGYTPVSTSVLTDRATYEADPSKYVPDNTASVYSYAATAPQGFTVTADTVSKGYEYELTANPTSNWRVAFNAAETTATRNNVGGKLLDDFVNYMDTALAGPAGQMRMYSGGPNAQTVLANVWNTWRGNYTLMKLQEGAAASELRKWRYNIVSNYSFKSGILKGAGVGASYRWQDKVVIGYPVVAVSASKNTFDLTKPFYGPSEDAVDLWVSYAHKITKTIDWKIQLNVRNAFGKDGLIPISVEPDGKTWASARVKPVREWFVTNTFSF